MKSMSVFVIFLSLLISSAYLLFSTTQLFVSAISISVCPGGTKTVSGGNIGAATVSGVALSNCDLTIENTETTGIVFSGPVNNVNITIRNIICTATNANTDCIKFSSAISNAHNLIFENISDTHTIASGSSNVAMVRYVGTVSGVSGTWSHRNSAMKVTSSSGSGGTYIYGVFLEDDVSGAVSIDFSGLSLMSDVSDSTGSVNVRLVVFGKSVTLQGTTASTLAFSNSSMKGSTLSANNDALFIGLHFSETGTRIYSGISKFVVDGLDMSNSSVTSSTTSPNWKGVFFRGSTTLTMVHDASITIKGVLLEGSASAAVSGIVALHVVEFRVLSDVNSIVVGDSQMDFGAGDGATTTGTSMYIWAYAVRFPSSISDIDSITLRNVSIRGKYSTAGSAAYVALRLLCLDSTATNVSQITVSDCTIHPTNASSSQSYANSFIASFGGDISGNSADMNSALTFRRSTIRGTIATQTTWQSAVVWVEASVSDYNSITANDNVVSASVACSTNFVRAYVIYFKNSVTLQGKASSALIFSNNSMKGSVITANSYVWLMAVVFGDNSVRTYSGISKFVMDGLDMSNSSITSSSSEVEVLGVFFEASTTLSMVHDGNVIIKGVLLGGSASAAASHLGLYVVLFRTLTNINSILVADSQMDFGAGDGATTTGASTYIQASSVRFESAISNIALISVHNTSIMGKYSATGSSAYLALRVLDLRSTATNVSKITVTDSTIHPTDASSSQSYVSSIIAHFPNTVSGNSADSNSALTFSGNSIRGTVTAMAAVPSAIVWFGTNAAVTDYNSITANDNVVSASVASSTNFIRAYVNFKNSVTLQGKASSALIFSNNSMKGSVITANGYVQFFGVRFGDGPARAYSGISKFVVDGLDMSNSSITSSSSEVEALGVFFEASTTLSMVHDGNVTIKGVLLGGSASAAATSLTVNAVLFRSLSSVNSILVADSQMDFSSGDGATTTGASTFIRVWSVYFISAISDIDSITVRNVSITGKYSATGSSAYVELEALRFQSTVTNVSKITVSDSTIHPTDASSSQNSINAFMAHFSKTVSGNSADINSALTFSGNSIRGTMTASSYVRSAVVWFDTSAVVTDYNSITANDNLVSASMTSSASYAQMYVICFVNSVALQGRASSALVFSNNSMKGSIIFPNEYVYAFGLYFGDGTNTRTYSGISKFVVDGLDMSNSSVASSSNQVDVIGVNFASSTTLSMVHDGNVTIKGVLLGGSVSAAATYLILHVVLFRGLTNINSILVADSQMDFSSSGDGAITTGASTYISAWAVRFASAISDIDSITVRKISIRGKYSTSGSSAYISQEVLRLDSTTNVSRITMTDSTIHPTDLSSSSSSQSFINVFMARFANTVSGNNADTNSALTFNGNTIRGTMTASSYAQSAVVWFDSTVSVAVTDYNIITGNDNVVSASMTSSASYVDTFFMYFGRSASLQGRASSVLTFSNNSMKGSNVSAVSAAQFFGLLFGDTITGTFSGISRFVVDGLDMSNSSVTSSTKSGSWIGVFFRASASLSMLHDSNITIKGVLIGGSVSAAATGLYLHVVAFRTLVNVNSITVGDSQMDFSTGDSATTTGGSTYIQASPVRFESAISNIALISVHNTSIMGKYNMTAFVDFMALRLNSAATNVSQIAVTDCTIHPTSASSSQSYVNSFIAYFPNTVSGNSADSSSSLIFNGNTIRGRITANSTMQSAVVWFDTNAAVTDYNSITASDNVVCASMTSSTSYVEAYIIYFKNSVTLQGTASSSTLTFSNNSMKGAIISASSYVRFIGLRFGDGSACTYTGIAKFVIDGLDMTNSSLTSTTSYVGCDGVYFDGYTTLSMAHNGNVAIKGVLLGGSASAAATSLTLYVVVFRTLSNVNSILVADSQTDFSAGEGATTTASSAYIRAWSVYFISGTSDIDSITVRNVSITGKYSTAGSGASVALTVLRVYSTATNVSKITVTDSTIHPTDPSSSPSYINTFIAFFGSDVSGNSADTGSALTFNGNTIRGTMTASSYVQSAIVWFTSSADVTSYNSVTANDNVVSASMTSSGDSVETQILNFRSSVALQGTSSSVLTFTNNSMKGCRSSGSNYVQFIGVLFGDFSARTYTGIAKFVIDGLDMSHSSLTSTASSVGCQGTFFSSSATLSMVHGGNITINGVVLLGGSASAASDGTFLLVVLFRGLTAVKSIVVADSQMDFGGDASGDGAAATTTGAFAYILASSVYFTSAISDIESLMLRNCSMAGVFLAAGLGSSVDLRLLNFGSAVANVGRITVTDSMIHRASASSSSQSHVDVAVASFLSSVRSISAEVSFVNCRVQGAFSSQNGSSSSLAIVRFSNTVTLSHVNLLSLSRCSLNITEARKTTAGDGSTIEASLLRSDAQIENVELVRVEKSVFAVVVDVVVPSSSSGSSSSSSTNGPAVVMLQPVMLNSSNRLSVRRIIFEDADLTFQLNVIVASSSSSTGEKSVVSLLFAALNMSARQMVNLTEVTVRRVHAVVISSSSNNNVSAAVALLSFQKTEASSSSQSQNAHTSTSISLIGNSLVSQLPSLCAAGSSSSSGCNNTLLREPACLLALPFESVEEKNNDPQTAAAATTTTTTTEQLFLNVSNNNVSANLAFVGAVSSSSSLSAGNQKTTPRFFLFENNRFVSLPGSSTSSDDVVVKKQRNIFQSLMATATAAATATTSPSPLHNFSGSSFELFCNFWGSDIERRFDRIARPTATYIALHCLSTTASKTFSDSQTFSDSKLSVTDNATESIFISRSSEAISNSRTHTPTSTITVVVPPSRTISRTNSITREVVVSKTLTPLQHRSGKTQSISISATPSKRKARPPPPSRSEFVAALVTTSDVATYLTVGGTAGSSGALGARFRAVQGVMLGLAEGRCSSSSSRDDGSGDYSEGDDNENNNNNSSSSSSPPPVAAEPPPRSQSLFRFRIEGGHGYDAGTILSALLVCIIAFVALNVWHLFLVRFFPSPSENEQYADDDDRSVHVSSSSTSIRRVIADSSSLSGVVFFVTLYLDPCLSAAVTLPLSYLRQSSKSTSTSLLWAILGPALVVGFILFPLCAAVFSKIFNRGDDDHRDVFVVTEDDDDADEHQQSAAHRDPSSSLAASFVTPVRKLFFWLFGPKGEWTFPISKDEREAKQHLKRKKQRNDDDDEEEVLRRKIQSEQVAKFNVAHQKFQLAVPLIEPYTDSFKKFIVVDVAALLGFAAANILGEVLLDASTGCVSKVVVMIVVLALYLIVVLYYRPSQERALRFFVPVMTGLQLAALIVVLVTAGDDNTSTAETLLLIAASLQGPLSFLMWSYFVLLLFQNAKRRCAKKKKNERKKRNNSGSKSNDGDDDEEEEGEELQRPLALDVVASSSSDDDNDNDGETRSSRTPSRRGEGGGSARNKRAPRRATTTTTTTEQESASSSSARSPSASTSWRRFQMNLSDLVDGTGAANDDALFVGDGDDEDDDGGGKKSEQHGLQLLRSPAGSPSASRRRGGHQRSPRRRTSSSSSSRVLREEGVLELSTSQRRFAIDFELI